MSPARLPACPARVAPSRLSAAPGIPDGRVPGSQRPSPPSPSCWVPVAIPFLLGPRLGLPHLHSPRPFFSLRGSVARRPWVLGPALGRASAAPSAKWAFRKLRLPRDPVLGPNVVSQAQAASALKKHLLSQTLGTRAVPSTCSALPSKSRPRPLVCRGAFPNPGGCRISCSLLRALPDQTSSV